MADIQSIVRFGRDMRKEWRRIFRIGTESFATVPLV
jgi:hypothetical protein